MKIATFNHVFNTWYALQIGTNKNTGNHKVILLDKATKESQVKYFNNEKLAEAETQFQRLKEIFIR